MNAIEVKEIEIDPDILDNLYDFGFHEDNRFQSIEELVDYLNEVVIPYYLILKNEKLENGKIVEYTSIKLSALANTNISAIEFYHAMNYLNQENIRVEGNDPFLDEIFPNYTYISTYRYINSNMEVLDKKELEDLIKEYKRTNDKKIKEKIIEASFRIVRYRCFKYLKFTDHKLEELYSYGFEALIKCIDDYDESTNQFYSYASQAISWKLGSYIPRLEGFKDETWYFDYVTTRYNLISSYEKELLNYVDIDDLVIEELKQSGKYSDKHLASIIGSINYKRYVDLDILDEDFFIDDNSLYNNITKEYLINDINNSLEFLSKRERDIIVKLFGLNGDSVKKASQLGREENVTRSRIVQIKDRGLKKIRNSTSYERLLEHYNDSFKSDTEHTKRLIK